MDGFLYWYLLNEVLLLQLKRCCFVSMHDGTFCIFFYWILFPGIVPGNQALTGPERGTVKDFDLSPGLNTVKSNPVERRNFGL